MLKKLIFISMTFFASQIMANPQTNNVNVTVSSSVSGACYFTSPLYIGGFGQVPSGEVGKTSINVSIVCSHDLPYSVLPINNTITRTGGNNENLVLSAYKNPSYTEQFTTTNTYTGVGIGEAQSLPFYFKLNGKGRDYGDGNGVVEGYDFSQAPLVYPIQITY